MTETKTPRDRRRVGLGRGGESLAVAWLEARGMRVLARNWRCSHGEADLIAQEDGVLVFVEVKTRRGERMGTPEEAITPAKRRRMIATAQTYLAERGEEDHPFRLDVLAVQLTPGGTLVEVRHYRNAVEDAG